MLSVVIATHDLERLLVRTLAALVPGATAGLITEVVVADAGSRDDTAAVADIAGCNFLVAEGSLGKRLVAAAAAARAPWLLFLRPGTILDAPWVGEARSFVERPRVGLFVPPCSAEPRRRSRDFVKRSRSWSLRSQPDRARSKACSSTPISTGRAAATPSGRPIRKAICFAASAGAGSRHCRPGHFRLILDLVKYIAELRRHDRR